MRQTQPRRTIATNVVTKPKKFSGGLRPREPPRDRLSSFLFVLKHTEIHDFPYIAYSKDIRHFCVFLRQSPGKLATTWILSKASKTHTPHRAHDRLASTRPQSKPCLRRIRPAPRRAPCGPGTPPRTSSVRKSTNGDQPWQHASIRAPTSRQTARKKKGLRRRNSPTCTLSQNGYGDGSVAQHGTTSNAKVT